MVFITSDYPGNGLQLCTMGLHLMDRMSYQTLRFSVECEVSAIVHDAEVSAQLVNSVMARFVSALANEQIAKHRIDEQFKSFDRSLKVPLPKWAHKHQGTSPSITPVR